MASYYFSEVIYYFGGVVDAAEMILAVSLTPLKLLAFFGRNFRGSFHFSGVIDPAKTISAGPMTPLKLQTSLEARNFFKREYSAKLFHSVKFIQYTISPYRIFTSRQNKVWEI
jgi:hypothetical protein